jgi:hypothetical protein
VSFTLSSTWTIGSMTLNRGQHFTGNFTLKDTIRSWIHTTLSDAVHELQMKYLEEITSKMVADRLIRISVPTDYAIRT